MPLGYIDRVYRLPSIVTLAKNSKSSVQNGLEMKKHSPATPDKPLLADPSPAPRPSRQPREELILALTDPKIQERDGIRRATAHARLNFDPADTDTANPDEAEVAGTQGWRFVAPLGPIELDDLRWYLEDYAKWPGGVAVIRDRAQRIQKNLPEWGRRLYRAAFPAEHAAHVLAAWNGAASGVTNGITMGASRRFSVLVDTTPKAGAPETQAIPDIIAAREAATTPSLPTNSARC
uniref:Uncharacterized protein n=1 Tax=Candidatus Kentrum sp. DK TaxID=2126562 RepID=A0A450S063_9GAMM|nr:MAG: hypothetical protein BECKDK2373B_GA0170837_100860 [Candidatus Kentron sp. DK]